MQDAAARLRAEWVAADVTMRRGRDARILAESDTLEREEEANRALRSLEEATERTRAKHVELDAAVMTLRARGETETRGDGARAKRWSVCRCGGDGAIERGDGGVSCGRARDERWKRGEFDGGEDAVAVAVGVDVDVDHARRGQSAVARTIRG